MLQLGSCVLLGMAEGPSGVGASQAAGRVWAPSGISLWALGPVSAGC